MNMYESKRPAERATFMIDMAKAAAVDLRRTSRPTAADAVTILANDYERLRNGVLALQARCCGSDDLCNGCRALLELANGIVIKAI